jgi:CMP-N-acetylneuraminic acid synthetase
MKLLIIIPAKTDSKRLRNKNILHVNGKHLIEYTIEYAKQSKHSTEIIVSSESTVLKKICEYHNVKFHKRNKNLCGDVEVTEVYKSVFDHTNEKFDLIIGLQPDNPNRSNSLDNCIDYMIQNKYDDLITVNETFKRSGSVRIFTYSHFKDMHYSKRIGCIKDTAIDIHYQEDLDEFKKKINGT